MRRNAHGRADDAEGPDSTVREATEDVRLFIFEFRNGRLKESRHYFDMLTFLQQIGAA